MWSHFNVEERISATFFHRLLRICDHNENNTTPYPKKLPNKQGCTLPGLITPNHKPMFRPVSVLGLDLD